MKIYRQLTDFNPDKGTVVTTGTFDGVHCGHRKILELLVRRARETRLESVVFTFFPHPRLVINPQDEGVKLINTLEEKAGILESLGVDHLVVVPFTRDFSNMGAAEYVDDILIGCLGARELVIGYDHRFGKNREGDFTLLSNLAANRKLVINEVPRQDVDSVGVSSTKIRDALMRGDVDTANRYLGYHFSVKGRVIKGDKIGRTIGFPTANLYVEEPYKMIPGDGIYAVKVEIEDAQAPYTGMAYIGKRPTINGMTKNVEVNIFDFDREIYGQYVRVYFDHFLRPDEKFTGLEALARQLAADKMATLEWYGA